MRRGKKSKAQHEIHESEETTNDKEPNRSYEGFNNRGAQTKIMKKWMSRIIIINWYKSHRLALPTFGRAAL